MSRCAVVTGGASGIGRAVVQALHDSGAHVVVADLKAAIDPPIERSGEPGADICFSQIDISKAENARSIVALAMSRFGRLDYLVNCAGILRLAPVLDITEGSGTRCSPPISSPRSCAARLPVELLWLRAGRGASSISRRSMPPCPNRWRLPTRRPKER